MAGTTTKSWDGSAGRFSDQQYERSCLIKRSGSGSVKERCSLPVREPDGTLNLNALPAAAGRLGSTQNISDSERRGAARKLIALYKANSMDPPSKLLKVAGQKVEEALEEGPPSLSGDLGEEPTASLAPALPSRRLPGLVLKAGHAGLPVRRVQQQLVAVGVPVVVDGRFGTNTTQAVTDFQQAHGLKTDGVVGRQTMTALEGGGKAQPGPLRAAHLRRLGMALARRGGGQRRRLMASSPEDGDPVYELMESAAWEDFGLAVEEAFLPGGGGGGEETIGGSIDNDGDNDESPDQAETIPPGTGTVGGPSARVRVAQRALASEGHYSGEVDGVYGPKTVGAVRSFQHSGGLRPTGHLDGTTLEAMDGSAGTALVESMARHPTGRGRRIAA